MGKSTVATNIAGAVIVTTPQEVAVGDALRGAKMFERLGVPVIGIVENMSYFESPETGKPMAIFCTGGGRRLVGELKVPLLGEIPLYPPVLEGGDRGTPIVVSDASSLAARRLSEIAMSIAEKWVHRGIPGIGRDTRAVLTHVLRTGGCRGLRRAERATGGMVALKLASHARHC